MCAEGYQPRVEENCAKETTTAHKYMGNERVKN
jgi:hypothetical protein